MISVVRMQIPGTFLRTAFDSVEVDNEVVVNGDVRIGEFANVRITKAYDYDLEGDVITG